VASREECREHAEPTRGNSRTIKTKITPQTTPESQTEMDFLSVKDNGKRTHFLCNLEADDIPKNLLGGDGDIIPRNTVSIDYKKEEPLAEMTDGKK
jgi:hypothetical protein